MSVDRLGGMGEVRQDETRRAEDGAKTRRFDEVLKKKPDRADKAEKEEKKDKKEKTGSREEAGVLDEILGRERAEHGPVEGRGRKGEGEGEAGEGKAGEGAKAGKEAGAAAKERAAGEARAERKGKAEKAEAGKGEGLERAAEKKGKETAEAARADRAKEAEAARKADRPGEAPAAEVAKKDDRKTMQEEIARNMFPGEVPHPFLLQQVKEAAPVEAPRPLIPPEIVDRIVERARFGLNAEGAHEFQIDLKQDVYAGLKLKIATKDGKVSVEMIAENPEVQASFEQKAGEIARALTDRGLNVTSVNVSLASGREDASQGESRGKGLREREVGGAPRAGGGASRAGYYGVGVDSGPASGKDYSA